MISTPLVLWLGHFIVGLAYYWKYQMFKTKEDFAKEKEEALKKFSASEVERVEKLAQNKWLVVVVYLIVGYFNILIHAKRVYKNTFKKG